MKHVALLAIGLLCALPARGAFAGPVADTRLVDQRGAAFSLRDLRGEPVVIAFVATRCADACPIVDAVFAQLAARGGRERLVTVSLDPRYDTPFVMSRFARALQARAPRWRVASGKAADVDALLDAFGVVRVARDEHSMLIYGLDARGRLVKTVPLSPAAPLAIASWVATQ